MSTKSMKKAPVTASVEVSEAEINRRVLARAKRMTAAEILALSVEVGIHTSSGELTPEYGGGAVAAPKRSLGRTRHPA